MHFPRNKLRTALERIIIRIPVLRECALALLRTWRRLAGPRALHLKLKNSPQRRIIIGTSGVSQDGWIPTDIEYFNILKPNDWNRFFRPDSVDALLAEHVWEHLEPAEGLAGARNCFHYLKPGGYIRVAVPDGFKPDPAYIEFVKVGGTGAGATDHRILFTWQSLSAMFEQAGFEVNPLEYCDSEGNFHYKEWSPADGMIWRSKRFSAENQDGSLTYTSIVLDAHKPAG